MAARRRLEDHLSYVLAQLERQIDNELAGAFAAEGAPVEYWRVLKALAEDPGESPTRLAQRVLLRMPTLTKLIDRMAAKALVYRRPDPTDGRRVRLFLADPGRALLARLDRRAAAHERRIEQELGTERVAALRARLEDLRLALEQASPERRVAPLQQRVADRTASAPASRAGPSRR